MVAAQGGGARLVETDRTKLRTEASTNKMSRIKSNIRYYLSNHRASAELVSRMMGLFTKPIRKTNVAMFHIGRCGSTVVGTLLNQHPKIRWAGELFANLKRKYGGDSWVWENPMRMIRLRTNLHMCKVFGFEIKSKHFGDVKMDIEKTIKYLKKLGYKKYIILKRENYLKREVSKITGAKMEKWNFETSIEPPKVKIPLTKKDGKEIVEHFKEIDEFYKRLEKKLENEITMELKYERDIKKDPKIAFKKLIEYNDLEEVRTKVRTKKINKKPIEERIENFREVKSALDKTEYEWMVRGRQEK